MNNFKDLFAKGEISSINLGLNLVSVNTRNMHLVFFVHNDLLSDFKQAKDILKMMELSNAVIINGELAKFRGESYQNPVKTMP